MLILCLCRLSDFFMFSFWLAADLACLPLRATLSVPYRTLLVLFPLESNLLLLLEFMILPLGMIMFPLDMTMYVPRWKLYFSIAALCQPYQVPYTWYLVPDPQ